MKTNKTFKKRLRVTKSGKILARKPGGNHYNAKESRSTQLARKRGQELSFSKKVRNRFIAAQ